ncbi:hypothetical protein U9M48_021068 [Paspalum notatum var. saurae]|uniref:Auxin-responsive protein n=1 Tax=Paspalum notatum var. saurae TaxID=547442 RepID=A0AAQ3TER5_PASNO
MAWRGRLGEPGDTGLELSLGLPAYFAKPSGLDTAGEESGDAAPPLALRAAKGSDGSKARAARPASAAPVVGWPPVRSFRRNLASSRPSPQSSSAAHHQDGGDAAKGGGERGAHKGGGLGLFVKINMDGVPIGRKVDLRAYSGYAELSAAVGKLFRGLLAAQRDPSAAAVAGSRRCGEEAEAEEAGEPVIGGDYTLVYEDEEGDRVLVGDVPWDCEQEEAGRGLPPTAELSHASSSAAGGVLMVAPMDVPAKGGFSFDLYPRNDMLEKKGLMVPRFRKTGTTIVGLVFADGVVLGADTRATEGPIVADKNCEKIHYMAPNIYCCGAGTAADTEAVTDMVSSQLELHRYATGRESRVVTTLTLLKSHLFRYQGHVSAALVLGGVDCTGPHLHTVYPHGSTDTLPFATMGSGSLAAMSVFESKYKEGLTREEGIQLVSEAICAGIFNDLGSGSNVDVCVITKGKTEYLRNHQLPNPRTYVSSKGYSFVQGQTEVLSTKITALKLKTEVTVGDAMEE